MCFVIVSEGRRTVPRLDSVAERAASAQRCCTHRHSQSNWSVQTVWLYTFPFSGVRVNPNSKRCFFTSYTHINKIYISNRKTRKNNENKPREYWMLLQLGKCWSSPHYPWNRTRTYRIAAARRIEITSVQEHNQNVGEKNFLDFLLMQRDDARRFWYKKWDFFFCLNV